VPDSDRMTLQLNLESVHHLDRASHLEFDLGELSGNTVRQVLFFPFSAAPPFPDIFETQLEDLFADTMGFSVDDVALPTGPRQDINDLFPRQVEE